MMEHRILNIILLITIIGEFAFPWMLKRFYKGYNSKTMVISVLGSPQSPVRKIYNAWLVWLGAFLLVVSIFLFRKTSMASGVLAVLTFISVAVFALGAGILAGLFSVNESKDDVTLASRIHGAGSAIGFMALLFFPLLRCIAALMCNDSLQAVVCGIAFVMAILFFVFFIMGDKDKFKATILSYEGLWERLSLFCMYIPFIYMAMANLLANK